MAVFWGGAWALLTIVVWAGSQVVSEHPVSWLHAEIFAVIALSFGAWQERRRTRKRSRRPPPP